MPILRRLALVLALSSGLLLPLCAGAAGGNIDIASQDFKFDTSYLQLSS